MALKPTLLQLKAYSGHQLELLGEFTANVVHKDQSYGLPMIVADVGRVKNPALLGRNWLNVLRLDWSNVHQVGLASHRAVTSKSESLVSSQGKQ